MTMQEAFWRGDFGTEYQKRNVDRIATNQALFAKILARTGPIGSVVELGAGTGENLAAIRKLNVGLHTAAVEINPYALRALAGRADEIFEASLLDWVPTRQYELAFTKGVLIHIDPDHLPVAYDSLWQASERFILVAEYYNPVPMEIVYRGRTGVLWKRDFAGEILERYSGVKLVDYGFVWKRDPLAPQDDITWFLLEKQRGGSK